MMKPLRVPGAATQGWLVLIGGGEFSFGETNEIDRFLVSKMPSERPTVAFLPTASGSSEYGHHFGTYLKSVEPRVDVINVPIYRSRDARRGKNIDAVRSAGMIYLGGGVAETLLDVLRDSPLLAAIQEALSQGAIVAGIGAGAAAMGAFTAGVSSEALVGLDLVPESAIVTGFNPAEDESLRRLMSLPQVTLGIGIPPVAALAIGPDRQAEIIGDLPVAVMRRGSNS